jgi:hypothetical protein
MVFRDVGFNTTHLLVVEFSNQTQGEYRQAADFFKGAG